MITEERKTKWERCLVYGFVVLGVTVPLLTHLISQELRSPLQAWFNRAMVLGIPGVVAAFPIAIDLARRQWVFTLGAIVATGVFSCLLSLSAFVFCCTTVV